MLLGFVKADNRLTKKLVLYQGVDLELSDLSELGILSLIETRGCLVGGGSFM